MAWAGDGQGDPNPSPRHPKKEPSIHTHLQNRHPHPSTVSHSRYEYQDPSGKYMLGCQGHPEKPATEPSVRQELFGRFFRAVERVRTRGGSVRGSEELEQVEAVEGSNLLDGCDVENGLKLEEECGIGCDGSLNLEEDEGSSVDQGEDDGGDGDDIESS